MQSMEGQGYTDGWSRHRGPAVFSVLITFGRKLLGVRITEASSILKRVGSVQWFLDFRNKFD